MVCSKLIAKRHKYVACRKDTLLFSSQRVFFYIFIYDKSKEKDEQLLKFAVWISVSNIVSQYCQTWLVNVSSRRTNDHETNSPWGKVHSNRNLRVSGQPREVRGRVYAWSVSLFLPLVPPNIFICSWWDRNYSLHPRFNFTFSLPKLSPLRPFFTFVSLQLFRVYVSFLRSLREKLS